jgi:hypothetical protein
MAAVLCIAAEHYHTSHANRSVRRSWTHACVSYIVRFQGLAGMEKRDGQFAPRSVTHQCTLQ